MTCSTGSGGDEQADRARPVAASRRPRRAAPTRATLRSGTSLSTRAEAVEAARRRAGRRGGRSARRDRAAAVSPASAPSIGCGASGSTRRGDEADGARCRSRARSSRSSRRAACRRWAAVAGGAGECRSRLCSIAVDALAEQDEAADAEARLPSGWRRAGAPPRRCASRDRFGGGDRLEEAQQDRRRRPPGRSGRTARRRGPAPGRAG